MADKKSLVRQLMPDIRSISVFISRRDRTTPTCVAKAVREHEQRMFPTVAAATANRMLHSCEPPGLFGLPPRPGTARLAHRRSKKTRIVVASRCRQRFDTRIVAASRCGQPRSSGSIANPVDATYRANADPDVATNSNGVPATAETRATSTSQQRA
jgi:hypothetical protein